MTVLLSQRQRLIVAAIYLSLLAAIYWAIQHYLLADASRAAFWFCSGVLMIVLGKYVVEPYFTTPADAVVNGIALVISLRSLSTADLSLLILARPFLWYATAVVVLAVLCILTKDAISRTWRMFSTITYKVVEFAGKSQVMFGALYLAAAYSFFGLTDHRALFDSMLALWICILFFDIIGVFVRAVTRLFGFLRSGRGEELGTAIGCDNPLLYKVEVDLARLRGAEPGFGDLVAIETKVNLGALGMVIDRKQLLGKSWLSVYILTDHSGEVLRFNLRAKKMVDDPRSVFAAANKVFQIDVTSDLSEEDRQRVESTSLFALKHGFVGYVTRDSNINTVTFIILRDRDATNCEVAEGTILKTAIYGEDTIYQVINGNTREEHLEAFDSHGYTVGIARKLGKYNVTEHELETRKWMPKIYAPLFFGYEGSISNDRIAEIATTAVGRLPQTDLEVRIKDLDAIVTHNTAILGILGIGKSCLAYELITRVSAAGVKVICIDITNEYRKELPAYLPGTGAVVADDENAFNGINAKYEYVHTDGSKQNPDKSGNVADYKAAIRQDLCQFLFGAATIPDPMVFDLTQKVRIFNVDYHKASRGDKIGYNVNTVDLTQAEKTRVISEELFKVLMKSALEDTHKARVLLVFEEAHSLIPEWNSVASEGDKNATNGTAKVILQGRKYGLGSLVITQRTANVSKSILNQCNTIFAMRVFDDTGKSFLENYIGEDYANTLPTLEERHAIAIGKGLRLRQPVIVQLNDRMQVVALAASKTGS
jgi:hypothetical protein